MSRASEMREHKRVMGIALAAEAKSAKVAMEDGAPWREFEIMEREGRVPLRLADQATCDVFRSRWYAVHGTNLPMPPLRVLMPELFRQQKRPARARVLKKSSLSVVK